MYGFGHTFKPLSELSDLRDSSKMSISLSMFDDAPAESNKQHIVGFRHAAISLNNFETDRCSSVEGYGSCNMKPIPQQFQDFYKKPNGSSSLCTNTEPRKIIKYKIRDLNMPDNKEQTDAKINNFLLKLGIKSDSGSVVTGNEVKGFTNKDEFMNNCKQDINSPEACEKAWVVFQARGAKSLPPVDKTTGGLKKEASGLTNNKDFEDKFSKLEDIVGKQSDMLKKYEDFFTAEQVKKEKQMKDLMKLPFSEEAQKVIEDLDYDSVQLIKPIMDMLIKEHPEIIPTINNATEIQDMNTDDILKMMGKSRVDMKEANDLVATIKEDAEKRLNERWSKKGEQ